MNTSSLKLVVCCMIVVAANPLFAAGSEEASTAAPPLRIGYSDWPGWVAWEVGIQKGWFEEAGVAVEFEWFEYVPSLDAFAAGQIDAVAVTNGDALVNASTGAPGIMILVNDYSNGNDMVVARPGIESIEQLVGGRVGVEVGFADYRVGKERRRDGFRASECLFNRISLIGRLI